MLAAPIINPIVIISTLYAFPGMPGVAVMRVGFGLAIALTVGLLLFAWQKTNPGALSLKAVYKPSKLRRKTCVCDKKSAAEKTDMGFGEKLEKMLYHAGGEFFSVGKYLIIGAFITSVIQITVPESVFTSVGGMKIVSISVMMLMAFLFSACSTSDAFIARSYYPKLPLGGIMGFLVYGPMMDLKNILMLFSSFKKSFVIRLALLITAVNLVLLLIFTSIFL